MRDHTPEAAEAIESHHRQFTHRLWVDWNNNGQFDHPLSDMSQYVTNTVRDQALTSTAPDELLLVEGHAAASLTVEVVGEYGGAPLSSHFAPYNARSVFYAQGLQLGVDMRYDIGVWTDNGWEWFRQFTGIVREVTTDRETGEVVLSCLDNVEKMRAPITIPPYAMYQDYLVNGYKRAGLVDSSSLIDLAARAGGFSNAPIGYWDRHKRSKNSAGQYRYKYVLSVPFHGSMLPEIGSLDNEFEFHLTEDWHNGTAAERARAEQYRDGPQFVPGVPPYLACNAVPRGKNNWAIKKYWMENHDYFYGSAAWGTNVFGTWIYWTGKNVDEDSTVIRLDFWDVVLELFVRSNDGAVYPVVRTGRRKPDDGFVSQRVGPALFLPNEPGWHYIEAAAFIDSNVPLTWRTRIDGQTSSVQTVDYRLPASAEYVYGGLVTVENKYAISDLLVYRELYQSFITNNVPYNFASRANVKSVGHDDPNAPADDTRWGRNRITYTLREETEAWDLVKAVVAAEYGGVFFDEDGHFNFWNYDTVDRKQKAGPTRSFTLDEVENFSLRLTMDSVRNVWKFTTKTGEAVPGVAYDLARDGVPRREDNTTLPALFEIREDEWQGWMIPDSPYVIATHPYVDSHGENVAWDDFAPWQGYKSYRVPPSERTFAGASFTCYPRKSGPYWTHLVTNGTFDLYPNNPKEIYGFVAGNNRAFFRLQGTLVNENEPRSFEVRNDESAATYGQRTLDMSNNFWLQDQFQTEAMLKKLVAKFGRPIPVTDAITVPGDPRIQLGDIIEIEDPGGFGSSMKLQVLGINRELSDGVGLKDTYQVEVIQSPGVWELGHPEYSLLGQSTILG